jgi:hypothetical protein
MHIALTDVASVHIGNNSEHISYTWWFRGKKRRNRNIAVLTASLRTAHEITVLCVYVSVVICVYSPPPPPFQLLNQLSDIPTKLGRNTVLLKAFPLCMLISCNQ